MPGEIPPPAPVEFVAPCDQCGNPRALWITRRFGVSNKVGFPVTYVIKCKGCTPGRPKVRELTEARALEFEAATYATYTMINQPYLPWSGMGPAATAGVASTPA